MRRIYLEVCLWGVVERSSCQQTRLLGVHGMMLLGKRGNQPQDTPMFGLSSAASKGTENVCLLVKGIKKTGIIKSREGMDKIKRESE